MPRGKHVQRTFVDRQLQASMTAESDAMLITTTANWMDVSSWRFPLDLQNNPAHAIDYASVKEFDIRILCDADEDLTAVSLYGIFEEQRNIGGRTVTFDNASNEVDDTGHGLLTGDGPIQLTTTGTLPAELSLETDYWIVFVGVNAYSLATSQANALAGTVVAFTDNGAGTHTVTGTDTESNPDNRSQRLHWALLGSLNDGSTINVDVQEAYIERAQHNPVMKYYAVIATETNTETITVRLDPVYLEER